MKLERSKDWWMTRARREGAAAIGAGLLAFDASGEVADALAGLALAVAGEESQQLRQGW